MSDELFEQQLAAVAASFPGTAPMVVPGRRLIRIPSIPMAGQWSPNSVRALLVCDNWPSLRPQLLIGDELRRHDAEPTNFSRQLVGDEAWLAYSFNAPYAADHPALVPVIRGWLARFDGRAD